MVRSGHQGSEGDGFSLLAATLLNALPSSRSVPDTLLMQLHAIFGPMLLSALQLIDRREVVLVSLPGGRTLYQVTSSTGQPYTLYNYLPPFISPPLASEPIEVESARSPSPTPAPADPFADHIEPPPPLAAPPPAVDTDTSSSDQQERLRQYETYRARRIRALAAGIQRMYCPCAGFLFNSLGGERNFLCKHLLSVLIAHHTEKMVQTEVYLPGMVELLGLGRKMEDMAVSATPAVTVG